MASTEGRVAKPERRWDCWDSAIRVKSKIGLAVNGLNLAKTDSSQVCVCVCVRTGKHSNELLLERDHTVMEIHV